MVYKKYIKKKVNGEVKTFGPYYYESYRDADGSVKTRYISGPEDNNSKKFSSPKIFTFLTLGLLILLLIMGVILLQNYDSQKTSSTYSEIGADSNLMGKF